MNHAFLSKLFRVLLFDYRLIYALNYQMHWAIIYRLTNQKNERGENGLFVRSLAGNEK